MDVYVHTIASRQLFEAEVTMNYACRVALIPGPYVNIITYVATGGGWWSLLHDTQQIGESYNGVHTH